MNKIEELLAYQQEIANLEHTINLLSWELKISTPRNAESNLISLITDFEDKLFTLKTAPIYERILNSAINSKEFNLLGEAEKRYILNLLRHYNELKKIPTDFYVSYIELIKKTNIIWKTARENNDYNMFKPYLSEVIDMTKKYFRYINPNALNLYDVMLNHYETGIDSVTIDKLFNSLKDRLIPLIRNIKISKIQPPKIKYSEEELINCAKFLLDYIGFDNNSGMLGIYPHGYTEKMCPNDIRIAFKYTDNPVDFVTTIIHEGGHAIFEQSIKPNLARYENTSIENLYALHESQSRFYENILGRNVNFWIPIYDKVKDMLHLNISLEEFVKLLNNPVPSLIRTEADELTYPLHIILRYEIERDIFNDKIMITDIPRVWNQKMQEYLGVTVDTYSNGLMQDVHWSEGSFGYFPSYLLGTIYDGMFKLAIENDLGDINNLLKSGHIKDITNYLKEKIYMFGGAYTSGEVISRLTNKDISIEPIANYFENKYGSNTH